MRKTLLILTTLVLFGCLDNPIPPRPITIDTDARDVAVSDGGEDAKSEGDMAQLDPDLCYFPDAWNGGTCDDPFVEVNLVRGDVCAERCEFEVQCSRGCICFQRACIAAVDLR